MKKGNLMKYMMATGSVRGTRNDSLVKKILLKIKNYFR